MTKKLFFAIIAIVLLWGFIFAMAIATAQKADAQILTPHSPASSTGDLQELRKQLNEAKQKADQAIADANSAKSTAQRAQSAASTAPPRLTAPRPL